MAFKLPLKTSALAMTLTGVVERWEIWGPGGCCAWHGSPTLEVRVDDCAQRPRPA
jgi:hypothetical protein